MSDEKADLLRYLQSGRDAVLWKLAGLSTYDARRPMTPTGTSLLGMVKHLAGVEAGYLGATFERPFPEPMPWLEDDAEPNADLFADEHETVEGVVALYRRVWTHADATVEALPLDAPGRVAWWAPDRAEVTLHRVLVHLVAEVHRHAGHADVLREAIDGSAGVRADNDNLPDVDAAWWTAHRDRLEQIARQATA